MADTNAKIDVKRNGRGQIISYEVENTATYSPILLSDTNRQPFKKYGKASFLGNIDSEIKEFTEVETSLQAGLPVNVTTLGNVYIDLNREIDLQYVAEIDSNTTGNTTTGNTTATTTSSGNSDFTPTDTIVSN